MRLTTQPKLVLIAALGLSAGCMLDKKPDPVAIRPSLTIYPVQMAGHPDRDVATVVAVMLEQRGMESIEVDDAVFTPDPEALFEAQAAAFGAFVAERDLATQFALYSAYLGSPQRGVDEIQAVLVDRDGDVVWADRQTRESRAMKRAKPSNPMACTVFLVDRLDGPLDLLKPSGDRDGQWAAYARKESLLPPDAEFEEMKERVARLRESAPAASVLVYPARAGDFWSAECARWLADKINREGLLKASVAGRPLAFEVQPDRSEQKVLWSGARSIRQLVQENPPDADYILVADYVLPEGAPEALAVHTFLLDADGEWVVVDYQNNHQRDFRKIHPRSLEECCDLSIVRLREYIDA